MADQPAKTVAELFADNELITSAVQKAAREAVLRAAREGLSVPTIREGKVVWLTPQEVLAQFGNVQEGTSPPAPQGE
jgi:hypothetical protein